MRTTIDDIIHTVETSLRTSFSNTYVWFGKDDNLLFYKPANGTWSIAEILEHVSLTNHFLLLIINKTTAKAIKRSLNADAVTVPDNYMEMLRRVDEVGKHKSFTWIRPEHMEPIGKKLSDVRLLLDAQLEQCVTNLHSLCKGEGLLVHTTMTVNDLGKIDVYQYLYFLAKHIDRHITQIQVVETEFENNKT